MVHTSRRSLLAVMPPNTDGLLWLVILLGPFYILQRSLHREIQAIFLLLTRRIEIAIMLFSLLFFPGVLLHETSHYLTARLLGVRTGRFSMVPRVQPGGSLQLGYVETASSDWLRDALIGAAPLLAGGCVVAYIGIYQLGLATVWTPLPAGDVSAAVSNISKLFHQPDFWVWFYLAFVVSGTMLPSPSDRRAWLPLALVIGVLFGLSLLVGAGPWMAQHLAAPLNQLLLGVDIVLGISVFIHLVLVPPLWGIRKLLSRLTRLQVVG
jgi:hypothetical protein